MRIRIGDVDMGAGYRFDLERWPKLMDYSFEFPERIQSMGISTAAHRVRVPYLVAQLYSQSTPTPDSDTKGMLVLFNHGTTSSPDYSHDVVHWGDPTEFVIKKYTEVARSNRRPVPGGPYQDLIGMRAWMTDQVLELRDQSEMVIEHADEDCVWLRCDGTMENLLNVIEHRDIWEVVDQRAGATVQATSHTPQPAAELTPEQLVPVLAGLFALGQRFEGKLTIVRLEMTERALEQLPTVGYRRHRSIPMSDPALVRTVRGLLQQGKSVAVITDQATDQFDIYVDGR